MILDRIALVQRLKEKIDPRYFVYGRELFLVERCCSVIREHAKQQGYSERIVLTVTADFDWKTLNDQLVNQSLFSSRKLIELRLPASGRPGQQGGAALTACLQNQDSDNTMLIIGGAMDAGVRNSKWFRSWQESAISIDNPELNFRQFQDWIKGYLERNDIKHDREAVSRLAYYFEGNMLAAANEMHKLKLGYDGKLLTLDRLERIVVDQARFNVFALTDACLKGDSVRAVRLLHILKNEGTEPVVVLLTMAREARIVYRVAVASDNRSPLRPLFQQLRIWKSRENLITEAARRLGVGGSTKLLRQLARADRILKGRDDPPVGGNVWYEFERIILGICQLQGNRVATAKYAGTRGSRLNID